MQRKQKRKSVKDCDREQFARRKMSDSKRNKKTAGKGNADGLYRRQCSQNNS